MLTDMWTIIRKDLKEITVGRGTGRRGGWTSILVFVGLIGVFMPLQMGMDWLTNPVLPLMWSWIPVFLVVSVVTDSFAGERERNTLETLLASRLTDRAILFGKIGAAVLYGWGIGVVANFLGAITVNVLNWSGMPMFYQLWPYLSFLAASFLVSLLMGTLGVLVSLNAPTARAAYQRLSIVMLVVWFMPTIGLSVLPPHILAQIGAFFDGVNLTQLALGGLVVFLIADAVLVLIAMQRFQRAKLILS